jgi:hypothetical protein
MSRSEVKVVDEGFGISINITIYIYIYMYIYIYINLVSCRDAFISNKKKIVSCGTKV